MAQIVGPDGYPVNSGGGQRLLDAVSSSNRERPSWAVYVDDIHKAVSYSDWRTLLSASRRLWANLDVVKGATVQKAMHAVGRAWDPQFLGMDKAWGDKAAEWLREEWFGVCDVRGENYDFKTSLFLDSISIDRDGDVACLLTETGELGKGYPQLQHIPANRIGQRNVSEHIVTEDTWTEFMDESGQLQKVKGVYKGLRIRLGVILNAAGRPVAYRVIGATPEDDRDVSARDLILRYDPEWFDQNRGFSCISGSVNFLRDSLQSHQWEHQAQLMASAIGILEYNESGTADPNDPGTSLGATGFGSSTFTQEKFEGGMVRYFKTNGGKLDSFKPERPGDAWESFQDRVIRVALLGIGWPYSLCWKPDGMNGTQERSEIEKARTSIKDRQDLLCVLAKRQVGYAVSKAIKLGILPKYTGKDVGGQLKWSFSTPPQFSIDHGREGKEWRENYKLGFGNLTDWLAMNGKQLTPHYRERAYEIAERKKIKAEVEAATGQTIDEREMIMLTANEQSSEQIEAQKAPPTDEEK